MGENSKIEWTHHTFNPWMGCTKVSPGCAHCYAERDMDHRYGKVKWGKGSPRVRTAPANWTKPMAWDRACAKAGRRDRVFCASLADWLDPEVDPRWRDDLLALIEATPHLDWLLLSKRPHLWYGLMAGADHAMAGRWMAGEAPANVWLGTTVEDQQRAMERIPALCAIPARVRFLSCEPLLGPVDLQRPRPGPDLGEPGNCICQPWLIQSGINWVIVGGESGPDARPMHPDWALSLRDQCQASGVPFLFKQWGEWVSRGAYGTGVPLLDGVPHVRLTARGENGSQLEADGENHVWLQRSGKARNGRQIDGRTWDEVPSP